MTATTNGNGAATHGIKPGPEDNRTRVRNDVDPIVLTALTDKVGEALAAQQDELSTEDRGQFVRFSSERAVRNWATIQANEKGEILPESLIAGMVDVVVDEVLGIAQLGPFLRQGEQFTDIHFNGAASAWGRERETGAKRKLESPFRSEAEMVDLIKRLIRAFSVGEPRFDPGSPAVNIDLPSGQRIHALQSVTTPGCVIAIRTPDLRIKTLQDLIDNQTISAEMARFLRAAIDARFNIVIGGATGSGKSTFMRVLLNSVDPEERIVVIEDLPELYLGKFPQLNQNTWAAQTVTPNVDGQGGVSASYLMREVLRQDPDRICIGEVRGEEGREMLKAMSTGNQGSMCTIHADSAYNIVPRLIQCIESVDPNRVCLDIANSVNLLVHLEKTSNGKRISGISGVEDRIPERAGIVHTSPLWSKDNTGVLQYQPGGSLKIAQRLQAAGWTGPHQ